MPIHLNNLLNNTFKQTPCALLVFFAVLTLSIFLAASAAFASSPFDIEFPIPELDGCKDKTECKTYCDNPANGLACNAFAVKHGFAEAREAETKLDEIQKDGGPGGCAESSNNPAESCRRYCDNVDNIDQCLIYAREHNLMDREELAEAEKVNAALKRGAKLPPQCESAASCKAVCEDPADLGVARACFEFGKEAGLLPEGVSVEQAERAFNALESGKGPFRSFAEMRQCDNPPNDEILTKCVEFGEEAGFIKPEEAAVIKKTGGKGPGGCRGRGECEAYCQEHGDECFAFSEEHGLLREEDKERMREGAEKMKEALEKAPPEVAKCVREAVPNLDDILSGAVFPSPKIGEATKSCFENFFQSRAGGDFEDGEFGRPDDFNFNEGAGREEFEGPRRMGEPQFPPEVKACLEQKFGSDFSALFKEGRPSAEVETSIGECFRTMSGNQNVGSGEMGGEGGFNRPDEFPPPPGSYPKPGQMRADEATDYQRQFDKRYQEETQRQIPEQIEREYETQYKEQFNEQYREQYQEQDRQQYQQYQNYQPQPDGAFYPAPPALSIPQEGQSRPPEGTYVPTAPASEPAPSSPLPAYSEPAPAPTPVFSEPTTLRDILSSPLLANILSAWLGIR